MLWFHYLEISVSANLTLKTKKTYLNFGGGNKHLKTFSFSNTCVVDVSPCDRYPDIQFWPHFTKLDEKVMRKLHTRDSSSLDFAFLC